MAALEIIALDTAAPQLRAPGTGDTYLAPRALAITPETLTGAAATSSLSIAQTWNTTGTPVGFNVAITDSASNAGSLLGRFTVGGVDKFSINKNGSFGFGGTGTSWGFDSSQSGYLGIGNGWNGTVPSTIRMAINWSDEVVISSSTVLGWSSVGNAYNAIDVVLRRDAADTLALRRTTNAQTFRNYGTFTDASNYRRVAISMTTAGVATIKPEGAGTGASGNVLHLSGLPTSNPGPGILWNNAGTPAIGT